MITENISTLKINKLSQKQYDRESVAGNLNENEIYLTPDKSISLWQPNTEYKVGDVCLAGCMVDDWPVHAICTCIEEHTSDYDNAPTNFEQKVWNKVYVSAGQSYKDVLGNVIHTTYATKEDLKNLELPNKITGDFTVTSENGDESVALSEGKVRGRQGGGIYEIKPDGIDFYGFLGNFSLSTQGVEGNDTAKASWQEWLGVGAGGSGTDLSNYYTKAEVESYVNAAIGQALEGDY